MAKKIKKELYVRLLMYGICGQCIEKTIFLRDSNMKGSMVLKLSKIHIEGEKFCLIICCQQHKKKKWLRAIGIQGLKVL